MVNMLSRPTEARPMPRESDAIDCCDPLQQYYTQVAEILPDNIPVEIINGRIVVSPVVFRKHAEAEYKTYEQLMPVVKERGWMLWHGIKVFFGPQGDSYVPDIVVVPSDPAMWDEGKVYARSTILFVEIVSQSSSHDDHEIKARECGRAGVPLYLVVDPAQGTARLLSEPSEHGYQKEVKVRLGESIEIPDPVCATLDTSSLA